MPSLKLSIGQTITLLENDAWNGGIMRTNGNVIELSQTEAGIKWEDCENVIFHSIGDLERDYLAGGIVTN